MGGTPDRRPSTRHYAEARLILAKMDRNFGELSKCCVDLTDVMFKIADVINARVSLTEGTIGNIGERVGKCETDLTKVGVVIEDTTQQGDTL